MDGVDFSWDKRSVFMCGFHVISLPQCCCCLLVRSRNEIQDSVYMWFPQWLQCMARFSKHMFLSQALKLLPLHINPLCISCWMLSLAFQGSNKTHSYVSPNTAFSKSVLATTTKSPSTCHTPQHLIPVSASVTAWKSLAATLNKQPPVPATNSL